MTDYPKLRDTVALAVNDAATITTGEAYDITDQILRAFVVVPRADLPKVNEDKGGWLEIDGEVSFNPNHTEELRRRALRYLAAIEHIDRPSVPQVDEGLLNALTDLINDTHTSWDSKRMARYLAEHGVTFKEA